MTQSKSDYFVYISTTPERARWGVEVLGSGFAKIAPHQTYPAPGHPSDHHFDFKKRTHPPGPANPVHSGGKRVAANGVNAPQHTSGTVSNIPSGTHFALLFFPLWDGCEKMRTSIDLLLKEIG
jgi:hypothetical protein